MFYFQNIPTTNYQNGSNLLTVTNILINQYLPQNLLESNLVESYYIKDGDTPESLSQILYGDPSLSWLILLTNNKINFWFDWPLNSVQLDDYFESHSNKTVIYFYLSDRLDTFKVNDILYDESAVSFSSAKILEVNLDRSELTVEMINGSFSVDSKLYTESGATGMISRIVLDYNDSLDHFENDEGFYLDPLTGYLRNYLNGSSNYVITKRQKYISDNDVKRQIYIIKPEFALKLVNDMRSYGYSL
jgi:hypothetical protein